MSLTNLNGESCACKAILFQGDWRIARGLASSIVVRSESFIILADTEKIEHKKIKKNIEREKSNKQNIFHYLRVEDRRRNRYRF